MPELNRVLLVDDDTLVLTVTSLSLQKAKPEWRIELAESAEEALALPDLEEVSVAVVDYGLPGKDGLELTRELKRRAPDMPVILLTGRGSEKVAREAFLSGVTDYVIKGELDSFQRLIEAMERAQEQVWTAERLVRVVDEDLSVGLVVVNPRTAKAEHSNQAAQKAMDDLGFDRWLRGEENGETPGFVRHGLNSSVRPGDSRPALMLVGASGMRYRLTWQAPSPNRTAQGQNHVFFLLAAEQKTPKPKPKISPREREVLGLVLGGLSNAAIAETLFISEVTVKAHVSRLLRKFAVDSRAQLAALFLGRPGSARIT